MIKRHIIVLVLTILSFTVFSQDYSILKLSVSDSELNSPINYSQFILYNNLEVIDNRMNSDDGTITFIIDNIPLNTDSLYFIIKSEDENNNDQKIYINELNLYENNIIANYNVRIIEFGFLNTKEYRKYLIKHQLLPKSKKNYLINAPY